MRTLPFRRSCWCHHARAAHEWGLCLSCPQRQRRHWWHTRPLATWSAEQ